MNLSLIFLEVALVLLGLFVYLSSPNARVNRVFAVFILISCWWVAASILSLSDNQSTQLLFARQITPSSTFTTLFFLLFCIDFTKTDFKKSTIYFLLLPAILLSVFSWSSLNFSVSIKDGKQVFEYGMLYWPYIIILLIYLASGFWLIISKLRRSRGTERQQYIYSLSGLGLSGLIALIIGAILPAIGNEALTNYTPFTVLIGVGLTSFSIVKHRLFNIRALVSRSVAYIGSIFVFSVTYGFLAFGLTQGVLLRNVLTTERSQQIFNIILAVILAFTFPTIRRFFEKMTDRIFYRDKYDPQILVSNIGRVLATEIQLDPLSKKVIKILERDMRLSDANIVVLGKKIEEDEDEANSEDDIYYQTHGNKLHQAYHIADLATIRLPVVITDELASSEERDMLERHHIRAALTLKTKESFVGYLLLGDKRSGDIYSDQDIQTLRIIANELAVAIQNARSFTEIQRFNVTLREKIKQATTDLTHANHELKALDKAKDEFISMASHQLRTPLTAVRGYTSMVMDGDFGKISGEQKDTLKQSFDAATRMTRLVDDLLNVSRIQSGKFRLERTSSDFNKVVPEEVNLISTTASIKNVTVTFHPPKTAVPMLSIDEGKTRQCLMNLMDNAIYYSSTVTTGGKVDIFLENDKTDVIFRVVDNGIGVPKDQQAKLFKKFYRAPNAQKARPDGTGLGLFLVGKVVKDQAGEIIFESEEGKGSTFGFKLPIKPAGEGLLAEGEAKETHDEPAKESPKVAAKEATKPHGDSPKESAKA
ncbi:MAG: ATP-binding protein [bacterium]